MEDGVFPQAFKISEIESCCLTPVRTQGRCIKFLYRGEVQKSVLFGGSCAGCKIIEGIEANCLEAPTSCLDALEFSLLFCYSLTCSCLLKLMCPLKIALKCLPFKILILHPGPVLPKKIWLQACLSQYRKGLKFLIVSNCSGTLYVTYNYDMWGHMAEPGGTGHRLKLKIILAYNEAYEILFPISFFPVFPVFD